MPYAASRHVIGRAITADRPPADRLWSHNALDRPDGHIRNDMPSRPLTDSAMANTFSPKILGHPGPTLLTPPLFLAWRSLRYVGCLTFGISRGRRPSAACRS